MPSIATASIASLMGQAFFPEPIVAEILEAWDEASAGQSEAPALPRPEQLREVLNVAFLAGLETDEGRRLAFTLCCLPAGQGVRNTNGEDVNLLRLGQSRPFSLQEVRRLATTAQVNRSAIWVAFSDDGPLEIRGMVHFSSSWLSPRSALHLHHEPLPHAFMVRSNSPGNLTIHQGQSPIFHLKSGKTERPSTLSSNVFSINGIAKEGVRALRQCFDTVPHLRAADHEVFEWNLYVHVTFGILGTIQRSGHGGALIVSREQGCLLGLGQSLIKLKYSVDDEAWMIGRQFCALIAKREELLHLIQGCESCGIISDQQEQEVKQKLFELHQIEKLLAEHCQFVGNLAATDGALVLQNDFKVIGFGGEITLNDAERPKVYELDDWGSSTRHELDVESYGMRHRSAFRLASQCPDVLIFIVSQDGDVNLVFSVKDEVLFRRNIKTSNVSLNQA